MAKDLELFKTRLRELGSLPSVPTVLMELLQCVRDESTTTDEVAHLVGQDAALTARLLKLANSSAMGLRVQVSSITRAVALLGRSQVAQICLGDGVWSSLKPLAVKARFNLEAFELHSLVGAEAAQELARRSKAVDADAVYAAALLHDIGKFLLLAIDREAYADTLLEAKRTGRDLEELESERLGWTHSLVGGWLADEWGLPRVIRDVATWHHRPHEVSDQPCGPMVALVAVSNNLMKLLKVGDSGNACVQPIGTLLSRLNLNPKDLQDIAERLKG
jgi:putative nucleotidyltransferase with HDIG domain